MYVRRSVMIMEPMAALGRGKREGLERGKLREGVERLRPGAKRKRGGEEGEVGKKKKKAKGPSEPNPLSVKKKKARVPRADAEEQNGWEATGEDGGSPEGWATDHGEVVQRDGMAEHEAAEGDPEASGKRKRRRKHKGAGGPPPGNVNALVGAADIIYADVRES